MRALYTKRFAEGGRPGSRGRGFGAAGGDFLWSCQEFFSSRLAQLLSGDVGQVIVLVVGDLVRGGRGQAVERRGSSATSAMLQSRMRNFLRPDQKQTTAMVSHEGLWQQDQDAEVSAARAAGKQDGEVILEAPAGNGMRSPHERLTLHTAVKVIPTWPPEPSGARSEIKVTQLRHSPRTY